MIKRFNIMLITLILTMFITSNAQYGWGYPNYLEFATYAVDDYPGTNMDLNRCKIEANRFHDQLAWRANGKVPSLSTIYRFKREDAAATRNAFLTDNNSLCEAVFFSGHGSYGCIWPYDAPVYIQSSEKVFSNYTKWIFFSSCLTLNQTPAVLLTSMQGAHVMLGYRSISVEFSHGNRCGFLWTTWCFHNSEYVWDDYAVRWVNNGEGTWSAYKNSVYQRIVIDGGHDVEPAYISRTGSNVEGQYFNGATETFANSYRGPVVGGQSDCMYGSEIYGRPQY